MSEANVSQSAAALDVAEAIKFTRENPGFLEKLPGENLSLRFQQLPRGARRVIINTADKDWSQAVAFLSRVGANDIHAIETIRPLFEKFRPIVKQLLDAMGQRENEFLVNEIDAITPIHTYHLATGQPILHLKFFDKDRRQLFESRESTLGMIGNALGILTAIAQSFEFCRDRKVILSLGTIEDVKSVTSELLTQVVKIAKSVGIPESEIFRTSEAGAGAAQEEVGEKNQETHSTSSS